jgi:hypothetical protein
MIEEEQTEYQSLKNRQSVVLGMEFRQCAWFVVHEPKIAVYNSRHLSCGQLAAPIELGAALHVGRSAGLRP